MNYLTTTQAAEKWGITVNRVIILAKNGRIPNAVKIGSRWMIPVNAQKPTDGRTKAAKDSKKITEPFFRFPDFEGKDIESFSPPLTEEEGIFKKAKEAYLACRVEEAQEILGDLADRTKDRYMRMHTLFLSCLIHVALNKTADFFDCYGKLETELTEDFPYKKEMTSLIHDINMNLGWNDCLINGFQPDCNDHYHQSFLPRMAGMSLMSLFYSDDNHYTVNNLMPYELIAIELTNQGCYFIAQYMHMYLALMFDSIEEIDRSKQHIRKAFDLAIQYEFYYFPAMTYFYYGKIMEEVLIEFPKDFADRIRFLSVENHQRYVDFMASASMKSFYHLLNSNDYIYVFMAAHGYTNKEIANRLGISVNAVSHHFSVIYDTLAVKNRAELVDFYYKTINAAKPSQ